MQIGRAISPQSIPASSVEAYERRLDKDSRWALDEGSIFFEGGGSVQKALRAITRRLNEMEIPYAVAGGLALFKHGHRRFTEVVDLLVTPDSLKMIHEKLDGRGYVPPFTGSKHLRDAGSGAKIEFLTTGGFPGDGKPKPVSFPEPRAVSVELDGSHYVNLNTLVELKLASGMSGKQRLKDLVDVMELIKTLKLASDFGRTLNSYVQDKYFELWNDAQETSPNEEP